MGGVVSVVKVVVIGAPVSPPAVARTAKVCWPSATVVVNGEVQAPKAAESTLHAKVAGLIDDVNANMTVASLPSAGGCDVIVVSGTMGFASGVGGVIPASGGRTSRGPVLASTMPAIPASIPPSIPPVN